jgi:RNA-binding protein 25
LYAKLPKDKD